MKLQDQKINIIINNSDENRLFFKTGFRLLLPTTHKCKHIMSICDKKKKGFYKFFVLLTKKTTFKYIVIFKIDLLFIAQFTETNFSFYGLSSFLTL